MARSAIANARLLAVQAAKRLHRKLRLKERVTQGSGCIDVYDVISELDIPLIFKPLENVMGVCLTDPVPGILITTKRTRNLQRFTAAHELGHVCLKHESSLDFEILERGSLGPTTNRDLKEVQAEAFASEFLLPRWLYKHHITEQGWSISDVKIPENAYQLSLRMGASFTATCWGLLGHQILDSTETGQLVKAKVAELKKKLGQGIALENSWADVWRFTENDSGKQIEGNPDDLLRIDLKEMPSSGYRWDSGNLRELGFTVLTDGLSDVDNSPRYGAQFIRTLIARSTNSGWQKCTLIEHQPWQGPKQDDSSFQLKMNLSGQETGGMSRAGRRRSGVPDE